MPLLKTEQSTTLETIAMTNWDHSKVVLSNRSGEIWGRGLAQLGETIGEGIAGYRRQKQEKEQEQAAVDWIRANGGELGINTGDEGEIKAAVKAAGGGPGAMRMIADVESRRRQRQMDALQLGEILRQREQAATDRTALAGATAPVAGTRPRTAAEGAFIMRDPNIATQRDPTGDEAVLRYLRAGGSGEGASRLAQTYASMEKMKAGGRQFLPELVDLGGGVSAMTTSRGSAVPVSKGAAAAPKPFSNAGKLLADADALAGGGRKEDADLLRGIVQKQGSGTPMSHMEFMMMKYMEGEMGEEYQRYLGGFGGKGGGKPKADDAAAGDGKPAKVTTKEEFDKLPKGARFEFNGKVGIKK
jgi:hypothetical protein